MSHTNLHQFEGEHLHAYIWRVDSAMSNANDGRKCPRHLLVRKVIRGLHPSIRKLTNLKLDWTFDELLQLGNKLSQFLLPDDPFWSHGSGPEPGLPHFQIHPEAVINEKPLDSYEPSQPVRHSEFNSKQNPEPEWMKDAECYRCLGRGHFARDCRKKRVPKPKKNTAIKKMKIRTELF